MVFTGNINVRLNTQQSINLVFQPSFTDDELLNSFRLIRNLYAGKFNLGLVGTMQKVVGKTNHCAPKYKGKAVLSERCIEVKYCDAGLKWCYEEFVNTYYDQLAAFYSTANGTVNARQLINLLVTLMQQAIRLDVERGAWFCQSDSEDDDYNWCDGIFYRMEGIINTGEVGYYEDSNQGTQLTDEQAYNLLKSVVKNARPELKKMMARDKRIHIGGDLWEQVICYLEDAAIANGFINVFETPEEGIAATYKGIPVVVHYRWDDILLSDFDLEHQNRILYTVRDNLVIATDLRANATGGQGFFRIYQEPLTDILYLYAKFVFDTNYVWPELISIAY